MVKRKGHNKFEKETTGSERKIGKKSQHLSQRRNDRRNNGMGRELQEKGRR